MQDWLISHFDRLPTESLPDTIHGQQDAFSFLFTAGVGKKTKLGGSGVQSIADQLTAPYPGPSRQPPFQGQQSQALERTVVGHPFADSGLPPCRPVRIV